MDQLAIHHACAASPSKIRLDWASMAGSVQGIVDTTGCALVDSAQIRGTQCTYRGTCETRRRLALGKLGLASTPRCATRDNSCSDSSAFLLGGLRQSTNDVGRTGSRT